MEHLHNPDPMLQSRPESVARSGSLNRNVAIHVKLARLLERVWVKRVLFFRLVGSGIALSVVWALVHPKVYTSTTTLMPPDSSSAPNIGSLLSAGIQTPGSSLLSVKTPGALFLSILGSRTVLDRIVVRLDLEHHYKSKTVEGAAKNLADDTRLTDNPRSGTVNISVDANDALLASQIAGAYVEELNRVVTENSTSAARRERMFLEVRLQDLKQDLDSSAKALSEFAVKSHTIDIPSQGAATMTYEAKLRSDMEVARAELAGLEQAYSQDNVRVRSARARVEEIEQQLNKTMGQVDTREGDTNSAYPTVSQLPRLGVTFADLQRSVREKELIWDTLTRQYESARVQEAKEIPTVRVLDIANVPQRRSAPMRTSIVIVGTMLSTCIAFIMSLLVSAWEALDSEDDAKRLIMQIRSTAFRFRR